MILLSALGFGSYGVWSRIMGPEFAPFYQGWIKSLLILVVLLPVAVFTKSFKPVDKKDIRWLIIPVILGSITLAPMYYAFNHMDIGAAMLIFYAIFLLTSYVVGILFLKEKVTCSKIMSFVIAIAGLLLVFGFSLENTSLFALLFAVIAGVVNGGEVSTTKKSTHKYSSLQIGIYIWIGTFLINFIASFLVRERQVLPSLNIEWLTMVIFALIGLASSWLAVEGFKYVDASIGGLLGLLEIISSIALGIVLFHETLTLSIAVGGGLIIFAAMLPDLAALFSKSRGEKPAMTEAPIA